MSSFPPSANIPPASPLAYQGESALPYIRRTFNPSGANTQFNVPTIWVNTQTLEAFILVSKAGGVATWASIGGTQAQVDQITTPDSNIVIPVIGNITFANGPLTNITGAGDTVTFSTSVSGYPITPYVVGPSLKAGYQTIQSALDAATAAGGGVVYVQAGTYTESLILYGNVSIVGIPANSDAASAGNCTIIIGTHTPPATGSVSFSSIQFQSATDVFSSAVAGSAIIIVQNSSFLITTGYIFNLLNWTGILSLFNVSDRSTTNGVLTNSGGAICVIRSSSVGNGNGNAMTTSGFILLKESNLGCPWNAATGTSFECDYSIFADSVTLQNNSSGQFSNCGFPTGVSTPLTMSSSGLVFVYESSINSSAVPVIAGAGAGTLTLTSISFLGNSGISGGLTLAYGNTLTGTAYLQNVSFDNGVNTMTADGQLIIGSTGVNPVIATLTAGPGVSITNGAGSITIGADNAGMNWTVVTTNQTGADNNGYIVDTAGNVNVALPAVSLVGDTFQVNSIGAGTFTITQAGGQQVIVGNLTTTLGAAGTIVGTGIGNWIELTCYIANTLWIASVKQGTVVVS